MPLCSHPIRHIGEMRTGQRPTWPKGDRKIPASIADYMRQRYSRVIGFTKVLFKEDFLCYRCLEFEKEYYENHYHHKRTKFGYEDDDDDELMTPLSPPQIATMKTPPMKLRNKQHVFEDLSSTTKSIADSLSTNDSEHARFISKEEKRRLQKSLNNVLDYLKMSPVKDL
jgi:hypothetical protein